MAQCPICKAPARDLGRTDYDRKIGVDCPGCGDLAVWEDVVERIAAEHLPRLSYKLRRMRRSGVRLEVTLTLAQKLVADPLPSVSEQQDNLLLWLGDELREKNPVAFFPIYPPDGEAVLAASIGAF